MTEHDPPENPDNDFDGELELEPVDPEIIEHQRQRAVHKVREAEDSADLSGTYPEDDEQGDPIDFGEFKRFRFSIKHLLIVTALLSVVMTLGQLTGPWTAAFITFSAAVAAAWWLVIRRERQQAAEKERRRLETKAKIAARRATEDGKPIEPVPIPASVAIPIETPYQEPTFDFSFSLKEIFGAFTVAAVILGVIRGLGGTENAALLLGTVALLGLVLHAVGFDPPRLIIFGWWLLLVLYIMVSLWAAIGSDQAALSRPVDDYQIVFSEPSALGAKPRIFA